ncbi:MAG: GNAT family N-acetyltransferase [Lysobacterales bacterium]
MSAIDLQPTLQGPTLKLRPLVPADFEPLYLAACDPKIWELHPDSERYKRDIFRQRFFDTAIISKGALAIEELASGRIVGSSRYYNWDYERSEIAIGYTFIERSQWGMGANRELKALMLNHIFQWAPVVWFHIADINMRSRRAIEKIGATFCHGEQRELEGKPYSQLYYKLNAEQYRP